MNGLCLYHPDDVPFKRVPNTYTEFRKQVEGSCRVRNLLQMPDQLKPMPPGAASLSDSELPQVSALIDDPSAANLPKDKRTVFPFPGGETAALDR